MVAGYDKKGPQLFYCDDQGSRCAGKRFSVGSASTTSTRRTRRGAPGPARWPARTSTSCITSTRRRRGCVGTSERLVHVFGRAKTLHARSLLQTVPLIPSFLRE